MRYCLQLAYNGAPFVGWQIQPNGTSVQELLQKALSSAWNESITVVGCGRTDAGVHAAKYFAHLDSSKAHSDQLLEDVNQSLPKEISVQKLHLVNQDWHARFSAVSRTYQYHLIRYRNPMQQDISFYFYAYKQLKLIELQRAADLLLEYDAFAPFCKSNSDASHYLCQVAVSNWSENQEGLTYTISANRFLRGMVRLIVGMCLQVALGKITLEEVRYSLDEQSVLPRPWSVPPQGLFLVDVKYPEFLNHEQ